MYGTISGTLLAIKSNAMVEPNKVVATVDNIAQFHSESTGTFNINISKGSYIIEIIDGKDGESGSNNFDMSSGLWCKGEAGTSGIPSSITYQGRKYITSNTSMNIINDSTINLIIGSGGQGGNSKLENGEDSGNCHIGSNGTNGSISIIPN